MQSFDTIVVGLGAAGSAALYQLARFGLKVLGIDSFSPPHKVGSSHGESRITRKAIGEGSEYTPLVLRSFEIVDELEKLSGQTIYQKTGGLMISNKNSIAIHHVENFFQTTIKAAQTYNIAHQLLNATDIRKRFPTLNIADDEYAYFEADAGIIKPETAISVQLELADKYGAAIARNTTVQSLQALDNGKVKVEADGQTYLANKVLVTAGPWLFNLRPDLAKYFTVLRQILYWFEIEEHYEAYLPDRFPIFIWDGRPGLESRYGFPALDGRDGGLKIASPRYDPETTAETVNRTVSEKEKKEMYQEHVKPFFKGIGARCLKSAVCLYTDARYSRFGIGSMAGESNAIIYASACSGHGFKHSFAVGEALAQMAMLGESKIDLSSFGFDKLTAR
ncbi:MAG: N-methyl-L-tryptophan oxidase [Candidatus Obscuribacterales bacterium]|nr:N-methyl-L-tryptophan oxidase [Candidatus Obscuribacterales bacterium]